MKLYFRSSLEGNALQWGYVERETGEEDPFLIGPKATGTLRSKLKPHKPQQQAVHQATAMYTLERMLASNLSQTIDENSTLVSLIDKKATISLLHHGNN
jgi:hypothetical protein